MTAAYLAMSPGGGYIASNGTPAPQPFTWRLRSPCASAVGGECERAPDVVCPAAPDRVVRLLDVEQRRLVQVDPVTGALFMDGGLPVPVGTAPGTPLGSWLPFATTCVDITDLNPPPSPDEVFRYFQTLPLPALATRQQPPGNALVGLPVVFYTDGPTSQTFTLDIRGFTVDITATAASFTWHTGDGTDLTTTDPGAPYPDHTISHDYAAGRWTASLTTTWSGTFRVDGSAEVAVPGTTTTEGQPVTFAVVEARAVLTDPYD